MKKVVDFLINLIEIVQAIYDFCLKVLAFCVRSINKVRLWVIQFIDYIYKLLAKPEDLEYLLSNYQDEEHYFI